MPRPPDHRTEPPKSLNRKIVTLFYLCVLATYLAQPIFSSEVYSHIVSGRWIAANWSVPTADHWTTAGQGKAWSPESPWFDLIVAQVERIGGENGLGVAKLVVSLLFVLAISSLLLRATKSQSVALSIVTLVAAGSLVTYSLDAQSFGWIGFALTLLAATETNVSTARKRSVRVLLLCIVAANLHRAFLSWVLLALSLVKEPKRKVLFFATAAIAALLCPRPFGVFPWFAQRWEWISQFLVATQAEVPTGLDYGFACLVLLWCIIFAALVRIKERYALPLLLSLFLVLGSVLIQSWKPYALLFTAVVCVLTLKREEESGAQKGITPALTQLGAQLRRMTDVSPVGWMWVLSCLIVVNVRALLAAPVSTPALPVQEANTLLELKPRFPLVNNLADGAYLVFRFADARGNAHLLAGADDRFPVIDPVLARSALGISREGFDRTRFLESLSPQTALLRGDDVLAGTLAKDPHWEVIPTPSGGLFQWRLFQRKEN